MAIEAIKKVYPIVDEQGRSATYPTFASQVFFDDGTTLEGKQLGLPTGGTADQVLIKHSGIDGEAAWKTLTADDVGALPEDGTAVNAEKLGGVSASEYALKTEIEDFSSVTYIHDLLPDPDEDIIEEDSVMMTVTADKALDSDSLGGIPSSDYMLKSDAVTLELLWTNPSVTSEFPEQTITLDLSAYQFVMIEFYGQIAGNVTVSELGNMYGSQSAILRVGEYGLLNYTHYYGGDESIYRGLTRVVDVREDYIKFTKCRSFRISGTQESADSNRNIVPYRIYGIKGVEL